MADDPRKNYPMPKFHFLVDWGGQSLAFTECMGLDFETQVIEYRSGDMYTYNKTKQPGMTKYSDITLKRGMFYGDNEFFNYWKNTLMFQEVNAKYRRTITIKLLDEQHKPAVTWTVHNAWASKITHTDLKADGNEVAIETMVLVHEGLVVTLPS
ncbi:MAG TPA: phage tail protein [Puia sp.]|nr:phage tail protein [Puia sp.]